MVFHTQPEERERRSLLQTQRMLDTPWTYGRGHGCWLSSPKCREGQLFWVRSSFERRMVELLNADQEVLEFEYEPRHRIGIYTILPDFVVVYRDRIVLVEVKASWALQLPTEDRVQLRALGEWLAAGEDEPAQAGGQIFDDGEAVVEGEAIAFGTGVVVAMRAVVVAELGENPVDGFVGLETAHARGGDGVCDAREFQKAISAAVPLRANVSRSVPRNERHGERRRWNLPKRRLPT